MTYEETPRHLCTSFVERKSSESAHGWLEKICTVKRDTAQSWDDLALELGAPRAPPLHEAEGSTPSWEAQLWHWCDTAARKTPSKHSFVLYKALLFSLFKFQDASNPKVQKFSMKWNGWEKFFARKQDISRQRKQGVFWFWPF